MTFSPIVLGAGLNGYRFLTQTREQQQANFDRSPALDRDVQNFKSRIGSIQTAEELVSDRGLLRVALGAFGLDDDINNRAFIQKVLESDLSDDRSLANRLGDKRYLEMAKTFGFNSAEGAQIPGNGKQLQLTDIEDVDDLLSPLNRSVLRGALRQFGLEGNESNTFFLRQVLESDTSDPASFVNRLGQPEWIEFSQAVGFGTPVLDGTPVENFVRIFEDAFDGRLTAEKLVNDKQMRTAAVELFGLDNDDPTFLRKILESDSSNPNAFVNLRGDPRYVAFSDAFRFGWPQIDQLSAQELLGNEKLLAHALDTFSVSKPANLEAILTSDLSDPTSVANQPGSAPWLEMATAFQTGWPDTASPAQVFVEALLEDDLVDKLDGAFRVAFDRKVREATENMFSIAERNRDLTFINKILDIDLSLEKSRLTFLPDANTRQMVKAFALNTGETGHAYPEGFADAMARRFLDRQFEVSVGETDSSMRLALSLKRELEGVTSNNASDNGAIYGILGSPPLREVFQTAMRLPSSFASIDIDQQFAVLRDRMESQFDVKSVRDFLQPEKLEELRNRYLTFSSLSQGAVGSSSSASSALTLLSMV